MISKNEAAFIDRFLTQIPATGNVRNYQFVEEDVQDYLDQLALSQSDLNHPWRVFFQSESKEICLNCRTPVFSCTCESPNTTSEVYYLDPDSIFQEWIKGIESTNAFSSVSSEKLTDLSWRITAESRSVGQVIFRVVFDGELLENIELNPMGKELAVGFVNQEYISENEWVYWWTELLSPDFWSPVRDKLLELQQPLSLPICRYQSPAAQNYTENIEDAIKEFLTGQNLNISESSQVACPGINEYIDIEHITVVGSTNDDQHIALCNCDVRPDRWHFHYYVDGQLHDVTESDIAVKARDGIRADIKTYQKLNDSRQDLSTLAKILVPVLGAGGIASVAQSFNLAQLGLSYTQSAALLGGVILLQLLIVGLVVFFTMYPVYKIRNFDWTVDG